MSRGSMSPFVAVALAALLSLTGALSASAAAGEWGTPVTLSEAGQNASSPQLVTDGTTLTAIWSRHDGSNIRIQVASSGDGGLTWGTPVTLSEAGQDALVPQLVTDGTTLTAIWYRWDGGLYRVQVASSVDGGLTWGTPVNVSEAGQPAFMPRLLRDGTTLTATWYRFDGSYHRVQVASSGDGGLTWGTPVTLSEAGQDAFSARLVRDGATLTAIWYRWDGSHYQVQAASSGDGGLTWGTPVTLSEVGQNAFSPQLVKDGTTLTASWVRYDGSNNRAQAASSVDGGVTWGAPVNVSEAGQDASPPQLVTDGTTVSATWSASDGSHQRVRVASSLDGGVTWAAPLTVSEAGAEAFDPQLATDGTALTATWARSDGSHDRVQAASSVDGGLTWDAPMTLSEAGGNASSPQLVTDGTTLTAVWFRYDGSNGRVQAASMVASVEEPAEPELAATGAPESLAVGLLAGGLLLAGGVLVAARSRGRRTT